MIFISVENQHDVRRFDVAMDQFLSIRRDERTSYLPRDPQRKICQERPFTLNAPLSCFPLDILHGIKESPVRITEVKNGCDVWMPQAGRRTRFAQEALAGSLAIEVLRVNYFQGNI